MTTVTRRSFGRCTATLALAAAALIPSGSDALAKPPARVGWWNTLSAGGAVAPAPTTPKGGLHIAAGAGQVLAYGAVLYPMPADATGQLQLTIASSAGTPQLQACRTKNTSWKAGDDQPSGSAPAYDCSVTHYPGTVSADGASVTFNVTTFEATTAGQLSLAIVPDLSGTSSPTVEVDQPFSVDIGKPGANSMTITNEPPRSPVPASGAQQPVPPPPTATVVAGRPLGVPALANPPADTQAVTPATPAPQVAPSTSPAPAGVQSSARSSSNSAAATAGSVIGGLALAMALLVWGMGRGLLGGRIIPLSVPLTPTRAAAGQR